MDEEGRAAGSTAVEDLALLVLESMDEAGLAAGSMGRVDGDSMGRDDGGGGSAGLDDKPGGTELFL